MTIKRLKYCIFLYFFVILNPVFAFAEKVYSIDINNPYYKKAPIAIPQLKPVSGSEIEEKLASKIVKELSSILEFTGFFRLISQDAFLEDPKVAGITHSKIRFENWTVTGAELLVTGSLMEDGGGLVAEFHLFDTSREEELVAKRYFGKENTIKVIVRKFGTEIVKKFTGKSGFFNSKIAFLSTGTGNKEVYVCDFDGSSPERLTTAGSIVLSPSWSLDKKRIAYTSYQTGKPDIYLGDLETGNSTLLCAKKGSNITPVWVPGEDLIAASLSFEGTQGIYLLTMSGKIRKRLTGRWSKWGIDVSPSFSPDGKKMAYVSKRSGTPQLYILDRSTERVRRLTYEGYYNTNPAWSPLGDKIAYSGVVAGKSNIFIIDHDGKNFVQLTENSGDNETPTWSPDGSLIAFSSTREKRSRIYVMDAYGRGQRRLLSTIGEQTSPKWSANIFNEK